MWVYAEQLLSNTRGIQLSIESFLKTDPSYFLMKEGKICFLVVVSVVKEVIWKTSMKG